jgi:hypothetical protein
MQPPREGLKAKLKAKLKEGLKVNKKAVWKLPEN